MDSMKKKKLIDNSLTYGLVIACWAVVQIMMATGHMTSLMKMCIRDRPMSAARESLLP